MSKSTTKIPVGISSCLLGERVRFDGGHKKHSFITDTLGDYFEYRPHCPEMAIGMGVPRDTIRLVEKEGQHRAVGVKDEDFDVTDKLEANGRGQRPWLQDLCGYIFKKDSPSCGMERVKVYRNTQPVREGVGLYTKQVIQAFPCLPVEEEGRLGDARLRENFIQRVFIYARWRSLVRENFRWSDLTEFHARHKYILYSHDQIKARALGKQLSQSHDEDLATVADRYLIDLMALLKITATRSNHSNVLQHIRGYLKQELSADDKEELSESIENYRLGLLPLIVPVTLLRHHFRKCPDPYIDKSYYLYPHPDELMLLNTL